MTNLGSILAAAHKVLSHPQVITTCLADNQSAMTISLVMMMTMITMMSNW